MNKFWLLVKRDARKLCSNVISMIVCMGLVIIPSMYAWFNIEASWDPYTNTKNLKVAVANIDQGYEAKNFPMDINVGQKTISSLRAKTNIDYIVVDEEEALEGIRAGRYYAAIVIPSDFSEKLMTVMSDDVQQAQLIYYSNEKENAIAPIITDKASGAIRQEIDTTFTETISKIAAATLGNISSYMDTDQVQTTASNLATTIQATSSQLEDTSASMRNYAKLLQTVDTTMSASNNLLKTPSEAAHSAADTMDKAADGVTKSTDAIDTAATTISDSLDSTITSFDDVNASINEAIEVGKTDTKKAADILDAISTQVKQDAKPFQDLQSLLAQNNIQLDVLDTTVARMEKLYQGLDQAAQEARSQNANLDASKKKLNDLVNESKLAVSAAQTTYKDEVKGDLNKLGANISKTAQDVTGLSTSLDKTLDSLTESSQAVSDDMVNVETLLLDAADQVDSARESLDSTYDGITEALHSKNMNRLRTILKADSKDLASFISNPVGLERNAIYPVYNNGSAMAPFYTTLSLWVGATILVAIVKVTPSQEAMRKCGNPAPRQAYFARLVFFVLMALMQATLVGAGDLFYLHIQCSHPWLFMFMCWFTSFIYMNIIYSLTVSFGDVGKAIAVFLLVIQVAGSGGTFPAEMLPQFFQNLYPFLPFVHTMEALRGCIAGIYGQEYLIQTLILAAFLIPSLLLGLILRKPVIRLNEWIEKNLESTKIM